MKKLALPSLALLLAFPAASWAVTDSPLVTVGEEDSDAVVGFDSGVFGSISPTKTSNGFTYLQIITEIGAHGGASVFNLKGFSSNPGQSWLTSIKCGSNTQTGSTASYTYSGGEASWEWTNGALFGTSQVGTKVTCTIVHS